MLQEVCTSMCLRGCHWQEPNPYLGHPGADTVAFYNSLKPGCLSKLAVACPLSPYSLLSRSCCSSAMPAATLSLLVNSVVGLINRNRRRPGTHHWTGATGTKTRTVFHIIEFLVSEITGTCGETVYSHGGLY